LAPGNVLDGLIYNTPPLGEGTPNPINGFITDEYGYADFEIDLDFPVVGGAYPFQKVSDVAYFDLQAVRPDAERIPVPVVNPEDPNISAPFLLRIVSHCSDQLGHGLSPGEREAWFQYP
jgi:hypothetical protein